jgi:hypothetical protein
MSNGDRRLRLLDVIYRLEGHGSENDWIGPHPYEALNSTRLVGPVRRSAFGRQVLMQVVKRSPLDLRPVLGIEPTRNSATMCWVTSAYALGDWLPPDVQDAKLKRALDTLLAMRTAGYEEPCWNYAFDYQSRLFFYPKTTPNTIATSFAGMALLDAFDRTGEERLLDLAEGVADFFLRHVDQTEDAPGARFGYFPGDRSPVHNANTHVCGVLARVYAHRPERDDLRERAALGLEWTVSRQRDDGSWPYGEREDLGWVDSFHTGYVLDALRVCADAGVGEGVEEAWRRGLDFWRAHHIDDDGLPRYYDKSAYPIDNQSGAQAIQTLSIASRHVPDCLEQAWKVFDWSVEHMRRRDGLFYFQRRRHWVNPTPHMGWTEMCMLLGLVHLFAAEAELSAKT